jgi:hypothetical protein
LKGSPRAHCEGLAFGFEGARFQKYEWQRSGVYCNAKEGLRRGPGAPNDHQRLLRFAQEIGQCSRQFGNFQVVIACCHQSLQDAIAEWLVGSGKDCAHGTTVGAIRRFRKAPHA